MYSYPKLIPLMPAASNSGGSYLIPEHFFTHQQPRLSFYTKNMVQIFSACRCQWHENLICDIGMEQCLTTCPNELINPTFPFSNNNILQEHSTSLRLDDHFKSFLFKCDWM